MTKRTAMLMAAGVVAALFAGSVALAFGLSGNTAASATSSRPDPIVRTVHRTVRVEKPAKPADQPVQVVTLSSDTSSVDAVSSDDDAVQEGSEDDAYEDDGSDDQYEDESDDGAVEDHEAEDDSETQDDSEDD